MRITGGSDLARLQTQQRLAVETRNRLDVAGQEMTLQPQGRPVRGDRRQPDPALRARALARSQRGLQTTIALTELRLDVMQESLGSVLSSVQDLSLDLLAGGGAGGLPTTAMLHASTRARKFPRQRRGPLNTQVAGQSIFAGTATATAALAPGGGDPRRHRRAGRRHHDGCGRHGGDRRLFLQVAARRLLYQRLPRRRRRPHAGAGWRGAERRLRAARRGRPAGGGAAVAGDGGGRRRRRSSPAARASSWRSSAPPGSGCSTPRTGCSASAGASA